jgi:hypothetical protein
MSLVSFANRTITVTRPGRYQDHGSWYDDWENPEPERDIEGCVVFPGTSTEDNDRQDAQKVLYTVLAPPGSDVTAADKIRVDLEPGLDLGVYGRPRPVPSPSGNLDHLHIELADWEVTG